MNDVANTLTNVVGRGNITRVICKTPKVLKYLKQYELTGLQVSAAHVQLTEAALNPAASAHIQRGFLHFPPSSVAHPSS